MRVPGWLVTIALVTACLLAPLAESADPAKDLKSKDAGTRLAAVAALREKGGEDAERLLLDALGDADWEVVEHAAVALGERGTAKSVKDLADLAAQGRVRRVRLAAANALATLDTEGAAKRLVRFLRKDEAVPAAEALAVLARRNRIAEPKQLLKAVERLAKSKEPGVRAAAAGALDVLPVDERVETLQALLQDEHDVVVSSTLDELAARADPMWLAPVAELLAQSHPTDVVTRRAQAVFLAVFAALPPEVPPGPMQTLESLVQAAAKAPRPAWRVAELLGLLGAKPAPPPEAEAVELGGTPGKEAEPGKDAGPGREEKKDEPKKDDGAPAAPPARPSLDPADCLRLLRPMLAHEDPGVRAMAVRALRRLGTVEAVARAEALLADPHERVRFQALHALVEGRGLEAPDALAKAADALARDASPEVREEAALLLGRCGPEGAPFDAPVDPLAKALADPAWGVAAVAAVSLGKTRSARAVEPLAALLDAKAVKDWRLRAAAVVGLGKARQKGAVRPLIQALEDKDGWVRRNAHEFLQRLTQRNIPAVRREWTAWWDRNEATYVFEDREALDRKLKRAGYAVKPVDVYDRGKTALDVVVLQSRGDHIEKLLDTLGIAHRLTRQAQLEQADMHSFAVFVSNCTGEIHKDDVDRLQWFVRVGGYLFGSCWALQHTVERVAPGIVRKLPTRGEVLDNVRSEPCPGDDPALEGVFPAWSQPIYVLFGSHLIEVVRPERAEVLIDSPEAAEHWGEGNLACWFRFGHGVILDSANHFDLQGLERATGLKTAEDRMAYAMDHMGLDYPDLRRFAADRVWERRSQAVEMVRDLSAFRFITNFVRLKRRADP